MWCKQAWLDELERTIALCDECQVHLAGMCHDRVSVAWLSDCYIERADRIRGVLERRYGVTQG